MARSPFEQPFVSGALHTVIGRVPLISTSLTRADHLGRAKVRVGIGRMNYAVTPGLYGLGSPHADSPVLVTANYKLSVDMLRRELAGVSAWLLVLDTNGINVWCAAGKRTFGTDNLIRAIASSRLTELVEHRRIVLPQLGAPGVAAHRVKKATGFKVIYGPIKAAHLQAFLAGGLKAEPFMRDKEFGLAERLELAPMELVPALKTAIPMALAWLLLAGLLGPGGLWQAMWGAGLFGALALVITASGASLLGPALLPWLPGRAFSLKGLCLGLVMALLLLAGMGPGWGLAALGWLLALPALASFLVLNFTGASTYTGLSGVKKEMRRAIPLQAAGFLMGLGLVIGSWLMG